MAINFVKLRVFSLSFYCFLLIASLLFLFRFGLKFGIDFAGGTILEFHFEDKKISESEIRDKLSDLKLGNFLLQQTKENSFLLRTRVIDENEHKSILERLEGAREERAEMVGPIVGKEIREKALKLTLVSVLIIVFYIAYFFREMGRVLSLWKVSFVAFFSLFQNVIFLLAVMAVLGNFLNVEFSIPILIAILTVLGYGINDTIVVLDRVRENILKSRKIKLEEIINISANQTLGRQINTSLTTLFPLIFIFLFGGETLKFFSLLLILGIFNSTLFSATLASSLLLSFKKS